MAFNSPEHRVVSFLDIYIEWQENQLVIETKNKDIKQATYKPGDFLEERKEEISIEDEIKAFEEMNFSKYDDKK
ncbi:MAG: hypothetical protein U1E54_00495 [Candidatus Levybacteria bacterium]|nr:hypothetical protein [Candidatus Levybacteria bacterium]